MDLSCFIFVCLFTNFYKQKTGLSKLLFFISAKLKQKTMFVLEKKFVGEVERKNNDRRYIRKR